MPFFTETVWAADLEVMKWLFRPDGMRFYAENKFLHVVKRHFANNPVAFPDNNKLALFVKREFGITLIHRDNFGEFHD